MDKQFLNDRKLAVKTIAGLQEQVKTAIRDIEELADQYGIRVRVDGLPATGMNGDVWYEPQPPVQMQEDTEDRENFDPAGTDWSWEASTREHSYNDEPFGWQNSSSQCS
jgi:hypothetical protein